MKNKLLIFSILFTFSEGFLYSQNPPDTLWTQHFGSIHHDDAMCIRQTSDGGFIISGATDQNGNGMNDIWLIRTDENGTMLWDRIFGGEQNDFSQMCQQTADGGFIIAGTTESFGNGMRDFWLIKTDSNGNEEWSQTFGSAENDRIQYVEQCSDGGYVITGGTGNSESNNQDAWLIKTNENGILEWAQTYGGNENEKTYTVHQEADGSYVLAGLTSSFGNGTYDGYLIKTDSLGNQIWSKTFGGPEIENIYSMQILQEEGYILAGSTKSFGAGDFDVWLIKVDEQGNEIWSNVYGTNVIDYCYSIDITTDGDYVLGGLTNATVNGDFDVLAMKVSDSGDEIWNKNIGLDGDEYSTFIEQSGDGGFIMAGYSNSFGNGDNDAYIVKLASESVNIFENNTGQQSGIKLLNYPNPFHDSTIITFSVKQSQFIGSIEIYNENSQLIRTFSNLKVYHSENQMITWNGTDQSNQAVSPGMYYAVLSQNGKPLASTKIIFLK